MLPRPILVAGDIARRLVDAREAGDRRGATLRRAMRQLVVVGEREAGALGGTLDGVQLSRAVRLERDRRVVEQFGQISDVVSAGSPGRGRAGGSWWSAASAAKSDASKSRAESEIANARCSATVL